MQQKNLEEMTKEIVAVYKKYTQTGTVEWTYDVAARDLPYQVGSLTKVMMQLSGFRFADGKSKEQLKSQISDELADILAEVLFIAHELDIDIQEAWEKMVESDETKIETRK